MDNFQSINHLLNLARGEFYYKRYQNAIATYEVLLRYITVLGNSVNENERSSYANLYKQYYEEYQYVSNVYNELLSAGKLNSSNLIVTYPSPLTQSNQNQGQENTIGKDIFNNVVLAGQAIGQKMKSLNEKYKITENTKKAVQVSIEKTKEFSEQHHIPEKIKETGQKVVAYDEKYQISQNIANGLRVAGVAIGNAINSAAKGVTNALSDHNTNPQMNTSNSQSTPSNPQYTTATPSSNPQYYTAPTMPPVIEQPTNSVPTNVVPTNSIVYSNNVGQTTTTAISYPVVYNNTPAVPPKPQNL